MLNSQTLDIPHGWEKVELRFMVEFLDNRRIPIKKEYRAKISGDYPYYGASGIIDYVNDYIFNNELILLAEDGANILNRSTPVAFRISGKVWVNNHAHVLKPRLNTDIEFLSQYLEAIRYEAYNTGSAQPKLNRGVCENIPVLAPPLPEQRKIAEILQTWDEAIEKLEALHKAKEQRTCGLAYTSLRHAEKNTGGAKQPLFKLARIVKGQQLNKIDISKGENPVWNGGITPSGFHNVWNTEAETITISEGGNSCGFVNLCSRRFWLGGHCYALLDISPEIDRNFLLHTLKSRQVEIMRLRVGSGLPNIQRADIEQFLVSVPPLDNQHKIARLLSSAREEITLIEKQIKTLTRQKRGLIQKLLTGEWRVQT